ncbi:MAG: hypothetical protein KDE27_11630 [Planctomycetes bacterium]|nr:hypothetical protein [Planctomycetota bacterium]
MSRTAQFARAALAAGLAGLFAVPASAQGFRRIAMSPSALSNGARMRSEEGRPTA